MSENDREAVDALRAEAEQQQGVTAEHPDDQAEPGAYPVESWTDPGELDEDDLDLEVDTEVPVILDDDEVAREVRL